LSESEDAVGAWNYDEGDDTVVCSLDAGVGGSRVDILGKHMSR